MNLLTKLGEKFKNINDETKKRIMATVLAGGIALSGLGMTGCTSCNPDPNNTNPPITNPGGDNGGSQTPGNNNGGTQTPGNNNGGSQTPDYSKYSQILQNVLTDPYYDNLEFIHEIDGYKAHSNNLKYAAIPYGFLEDEGFDISKFKDKKLSCISRVYTINNDLFIELQAEIDPGKAVFEEVKTYFANYHLKYTLTEQEMKEILALYKHMYTGHFEKTTYLQAPLFVQELSYLKTPEILSKAYITRKALLATQDYCNRKQMPTNTNANLLTYLGSKEVEDQIYNLSFLLHGYGSDKVKYYSNIYVFNFDIYRGDASIDLDGNRIYVNYNAVDGAIWYTNKHKETTQASVKTGLFLSCADCYFKNVKDTSIEELLANNN